MVERFLCHLLFVYFYYCFLTFTKKRIKSSEAKQNAKVRKNKGRQNKSQKAHKHTSTLREANLYQER